MPVHDFMALFMVTMKHSYINPPELTKPTGYTHVVQAIGGRTVYVSGQIAFDKDGKVTGGGDFRTQAIHVFENLKSALAAAGATYQHVVKVTTFVTDMKFAPVLREVRANYFGKNPPAGTLVQVAGLIVPELMIEVEAIAVVPE
jgi:enamine deaminase RidA (YjgF/YER057c/UK114 family)